MLPRNRQPLCYRVNMANKHLQNDDKLSYKYDPHSSIHSNDQLPLWNRSQHISSVLISSHDILENSWLTGVF